MVERYIINYGKRKKQLHPNGDFVRYSDYAALEAQLAEAKAERDEYYARGFGLRSHVVRYLNRNVSKETLRDAFSDWESASGTRFSISPAALEAAPAPEQRELSAEDVATFDRALLRSGRKAEATPPAPKVTEAMELARAVLAQSITAGHNVPGPTPEDIEKAFWALDAALIASEAKQFTASEAKQ